MLRLRAGAKVSGSTSTGSRVPPDTQALGNAGRLANRLGRRASCENRGSGGRACRRPIHNAAGLDVSRKA
jgi:hypothetical protein